MIATSRSLRIAVLGRTAMLLDAARTLAQAGHRIVAVVTATAPHEYGVGPEDFAQFAADVGAEFRRRETVTSAALRECLRRASPDVAISVNWPTLIDAETLAIPTHGIFNAHAGDLPRYRGNACPNWAILSGEEAVVLTVHQMVAALDAGPIAIQERLPLDDRTYIGDVYAWLRDAVPRALCACIEDLASGRQLLRPQSADPARALRCFPRTPADGRIDWSRSAETLARLVRASSEPFAGAFTELAGEHVIVWRARADQLPYPWIGVPGQLAAIDRVNGHITVLCGDGVLVLEEVGTANGERFVPAERFRSTRLRFGSTVAPWPTSSSGGTVAAGDPDASDRAHVAAHSTLRS